MVCEVIERNERITSGGKAAIIHRCSLLESKVDNRNMASHREASSKLCAFKLVEGAGGVCFLQLFTRRLFEILNHMDFSSFVHQEDTYRTLRIRSDTPAVCTPDIGNTLEVRQG